MLEYAVSLRRELHKYPEIGFDLPKTLALVRQQAMTKTGDKA